MLNTQLNAENHNKEDYSKLIERDEIDGSPFELITTPNKAFITMGPYRISPEFKTPKEAEEWLTNNTLKAVATMAGIIAETVYTNNEKNKQTFDGLKGL